MRQTADVLLRQKSFLADTLTKSKLELEQKMNQLESSMLSQNKNKSYLVSVEKAIKQSRNVAEISKSAMQNILQIVKFFKVEKIHQLVFQLEEPDEADAQMDTGESFSGSKRGGSSQARGKAMSISDDNMSDRIDGEPSEQYHLEKIQGMLLDLK